MLALRERFRLGLRVLLVGGLAIGSAWAGITTDSIPVGGLGTFGCQDPGDPPLLTGGVAASGTVDYSYDDATGQLTLVVTNTSAVTMGVPNPLINKIWINLPHLAVTGVSLLSQSGTAGATPAFALSVDTNLLDGMNSIVANCFGAFGLELSSGEAPAGAIANAAADTIEAPPGTVVIGPATFVLQISGPNTGSLTASAFSASLSQVPPGMERVNAALKFLSGGMGGVESGQISNGPECTGGGWLVGAPCIGNTISLVMSTPAGCHGCLGVSTDPGPIILGSVVIPIGMPFHVLVASFGAPAMPVVKPITIPNDPLLVGLTIYAVVVTLDPMNLTTLFVADQFSFTICP